MTGSTPALVITPVVAVLLLAAWIGLVFYADSHPVWRRGASSGRSTTDRAADAIPRQPDASRDGMSSRPEESPAAGRDTGMFITAGGRGRGEGRYQRGLVRRGRAGT
jgi:hypothetical protein